MEEQSFDDFNGKFSPESDKWAKSKLGFSRRESRELLLRASKIKGDIERKTGGVYLTISPRRKTYNFLLVYGAAASIVIGLFAWAILVNRPQRAESPEVDSKNEINRTIVEKSPKGQRTSIQLVDGTKIWLNSESKLVYSKDFNSGGNREVFLEGEAFFDVAHDAKRPFIVNTSSMAIKVLGTAFNVKSYATEGLIEASLVKGSIQLNVMEPNSKKGLKEAMLVPNQRAIFNKATQKLTIQNQTPVAEFTDWRNGKLYFEDKPINEVLEMMERWYNVKIYRNEPDFDCTFSGKFDNKTLPEVLEAFKVYSEGGIEFTLTSEGAVLKGKMCD